MNLFSSLIHNGNGIIMYCPKCKAEYREGFTECADCQVLLVNELPTESPEPIPAFVELEAILSTKDAGEIALIKSLLEAEDIPFFVQGDHFSGLYGHAIPVRILVPKNKLEDAKALLSDFL